MLTIGVSPCLMQPDAGRVVFAPKWLSYLENDMANYLCRKGVMPVLIPPIRSESLLDELLGRMDGFVFQGGTDLAPETYGETPIGRWRGDAPRDAIELKIFDFAVKNRKPILAICRGCQLMNVYFGGTLYQDIATQQPNALEHRNAELYDQVSHPVSLAKGGLLEKIYGTSTDNARVNTVHHQAIKDLGRHLEVLARSPQDGIIEAIRWMPPDNGKTPFTVGVQWHPEFAVDTQMPDVLNSNLLYDAFLEAAANPPG